MLNSIYFKGAKPESTRFIDPKSMLLVPCETSSDGVLLRSSEFKVIDPSAENSKFQYTDFNLANIIAVGSYGSLTPIVMTNNSDLTFVDQFSKSISSIPVTNE